MEHTLSVGVVTLFRRGLALCELMSEVAHDLSLCQLGDNLSKYELEERVKDCGCFDGVS